MHHRSLLALAATATLLAGARADVTLHPLFSDHTVLQRAVPVRVWGWADAGEAVTVTFAGQSKNTTAAADGKWSVKLDALQVGEPQVLTAVRYAWASNPDVILFNGAGLPAGPFRTDVMRGRIVGREGCQRGD